MTFRNDIQMLRGLSVLLVVLFHLEIGGFSSGYLGVDVFFVISGFLMAKLYKPDDKTGFYLKRAKRLLPAYFAVILLTVLASLFITVPSDFGQVKNQTYYALIFSSNIGFWMQNSYFAKDAFNPLLHLWSLGVEIQFYLLVPLIFWLTEKSKSIYCILLVGSLICCFYIVGVSPKTSFFITPFRLWEFLIGFGIAKYFQAPFGTAKCNAIGMFGLIAVVGVPFIKINGDSLSIVDGHPGLAALGISLAAGAVLACGIPKRFESNVLSVGLVKLGEYSYSIYLAHFPLIVLFLYKPFSGTILSAQTKTETLLLIALIGIASIALYKFVETPLRRSMHVYKPSLVFVVAAMVLLLGANQFNKVRYSEAELNVFKGVTDKSGYRCGKAFRLKHPLTNICNLTELRAPVNRVLLVGNSHADSIKTVFMGEAVKRNIDVYFIVARDPLLEGGMDADTLIAAANNLGIKHLVLHYKSKSIKTEALENLNVSAGIAGISVSFIMPVPIWDRIVPANLYEYLANSRPLPEKTLSNYRAENRELLEFMAQPSAANIRKYSVAEYFCDANRCRMADAKLRPLYFDQHHLTLTGSRELQPVFSQVLKDLEK